MTPRVVYDSMVFFQWATLPPDQPHRQHATVTAITKGTLRLCLASELLVEAQNLLTRPELVAKYPALTPAHVATVLTQVRHYSDWFEVVPKRFTLPKHEKDDHIFNLAIEANAKYLVTWETRILNLRGAQTPEAARFRELAPRLSIINPQELACILKAGQVEQ